MNRYFLVFIGSMLGIVSLAISQSHFKVAKSFHISSSGGWVYLALNGNKLYVSHGTQVNILDKTAGDSLAVIENTPRVHGIAFVPALECYTSNGRTNNLTIFDLKTDKALGQIAISQNPDAILYDNFSQKIYTCNGRS